MATTSTGATKAVETGSIVISVSGNAKIDEVRSEASIYVNRPLCAGGGQPLAHIAEKQL